MHELTTLIKNDMLPALGVTEPGAIAFCVAKTRSYISGDLKKLTVELNSGMYKNAFTCGIPNSFAHFTQSPWEAFSPFSTFVTKITATLLWQFEHITILFLFPLVK